MNPDLELPPIRKAFPGVKGDGEETCDSLRMRCLLEELYKDKKYLDRNIRKLKLDQRIFAS